MNGFIAALQRSCLIASVTSLILLSPETDARPKIGVALSGGGAKGAAHIGVLKVLEAHRIPVDYIAGTSMGSYVSGMYAMGFSAVELQNIVLGLDWSQGYSEDPSRRYLSFRQRQRATDFPLPIQVGYKDGELQLPRGLLRGQGLAKILRQSVGPLPVQQNFDELPIPLRTVATDLSDRSMYVFEKGDLVTAMQASMSLPGIFSPVNHDGRVLADGGLVNNLPIDQVRAMGADIIIAVDIGDAYRTADELNSSIAIFDQLSNFLTREGAEYQKSTLTEQDILFEPDISEISIASFDKLSVAISSGQTTAQASTDRLQAYSVSKEEYASYQEEKRIKHQSLMIQLRQPLSLVTLENDSNVNDTLIENVLDIPLGRIPRQQTIDSAIDRVYSIGDFEQVGISYRERASGKTAVVNTVPKSWGENFINLKLALESSFKDFPVAVLGLAYTVPNLSPMGAEWRTDVMVGTDSLISTNYYAPLDFDQFYFVEGMIKAESFRRLPLTDDGTILPLSQLFTEITLDGGINPNTFSRASLGYRYEDGKFTAEAFSAQNLSDQNYKFHGFQARYDIDTLDNSYLPTNGHRLRLRIGRYEDLESNTGYTTAYEADWLGTKSIDEHSLSIKGEYAETRGDNPYVQITELGGFLHLSGYTRGALFAPNRFFTAAIYKYALEQTMLGLSNNPLFLGVSAETGNVWGSNGALRTTELLYAGAIFAGIDVGIGPVMVGYGQNTDDRSAFYLTIGHSF